MAGFVGTRGGKTKFQWSKGQLERMIGKGAAIALQRAGLEVRKQTQRKMSVRAPKKTPTFWKVGQSSRFFPLVAAVYQVPKSDRVTSWKTGQHPKGFLRSDIEADFDTRSRSVVIGPSKLPWLNQLHEFGGSVPVYFAGTEFPVTQWRGKKLPQSMMARMPSMGGRKKAFIGAHVGYLTNRPAANSIFLGMRQVKGRGYMEQGVLAAMPKIPPQFRNTISRGSL